MKNVVLVTFDSLRRDHCGFGGYEKNTTPTLDQIAEGGLHYTDSVAPGPSTPESMPVIMTGNHFTERAGQYDSLLEERKNVIRDHMQRNATLAERFKSLGYSTAGFTPNPYTSKYFGFDKGFDHFEDFLSGSREKIYQNLLDGVFQGTGLEKVLPVRIVLNWAQRQEVFKPWEGFINEIYEWIDSAKEPYFVWVLLMDTHDPYLPPSGYRSDSLAINYYANYRLWKQNHQPPLSDRVEKALIRAYDDTIQYADEFVRQIKNKVDQDTILAVHGDHGESFGEHDLYGHQPYLYEENISSPLVIDSDYNHRFDDVFPLRRLPDLLENLALGKKKLTFGGPAIVKSSDGDRTAIRTKDWKYISEETGAELYHLNTGTEVLTHSGEIREIEQLYRQIMDRSYMRSKIAESTEEAVRRAYEDSE
ncbi:sulfatase-like hydrolase/transferase [Haloferax sp. YSMS24]|uniref:sulfatase-like hydrolase/transferase n=1 Tax=Haloferax sp. YSMS24 TaxID=3388425 RepID=UPI00398CA4DA